MIFDIFYLGGLFLFLELIFFVNYYFIGHFFCRKTVLREEIKPIDVLGLQDHFGDFSTKPPELEPEQEEEEKVEESIRSVEKNIQVVDRMGNQIQQIGSAMSQISDVIGGLNNNLKIKPNKKRR